MRRSALLFSAWIGVCTALDVVWVSPSPAETVSLTPYSRSLPLRAEAVAEPEPVTLSEGARFCVRVTRRDLDESSESRAFDHEIRPSVEFPLQACEAVGGRTTPVFLSVVVPGPLRPGAYDAEFRVMDGGARTTATSTTVTATVTRLVKSTPTTDYLLLPAGSPIASAWGEGSPSDFCAAIGSLARDTVRRFAKAFRGGTTPSETEEAEALLGLSPLFAAAWERLAGKLVAVDRGRDAVAALQTASFFLGHWIGHAASQRHATFAMSILRSSTSVFSRALAQAAAAPAAVRFPDAAAALDALAAGAGRASAGESHPLAPARFAALADCALDGAPHLATPQFAARANAPAAAVLNSEGGADAVAPHVVLGAASGGGLAVGVFAPDGGPGIDWGARAYTPVPLLLHAPLAPRAAVRRGLMDATVPLPSRVAATLRSVVAAMREDGAADVVAPDRVVLASICAYNGTRTRLGTLGSANKAHWAGLHGHGLRVEVEPEERSLHPAWGKLHLMDRLLRDSQWDWVVWVDCDTLVMRPRIGLHHIIAAATLPHSAEESAQKPAVVTTMDGLMVNTGFLAVRNDAVGRDVVQSALRLATVTPSHTLWDQGALHWVLFGSSAARRRADSIRVLPPSWVNAYPLPMAALLRTTDGAPAHAAFDPDLGDAFVAFSGCTKLAPAAACEALVEAYADLAAAAYAEARVRRDRSRETEGVRVEIE